MNRKILFIFFLSAMFSTAYASEILIAKFAIYDSEGNKIRINQSPSKNVYSVLEKHWFEGLIQFRLVNEKKYDVPLSIIDANRICSIENTDYLLYGFVKKYESNWFADIKLYNFHEKKVQKEFFSSDDSEHYERFIHNLTENILGGIEELLGISQNSLREEKYRALEVRLPSSIYYWSPIDGRWSERVLGIVGVNAGIELYLPIPNIAIGGKLMDFSCRFNLSWNYGINQKKFYPLNLNTIAIDLPFYAHVHFNDKHDIYAGLGICYELELMNIKPKYESEQMIYQNIFSIETTVGYELKLNDIVNFFSEIVFDYHLANDGYVSVKPIIGASVKLFGEHK